MALDVALVVRPVLRTAWAALGLRAEWPARVDDRFDRLWESARDAYPVVGRRDARFVRWRFHEPPTGRCELVALVDRRASGRPLVAYAALEHEGAVVHLRDLFGQPSALEPLLDAVIVGLAARGAAALSFRFLPARRFLTIVDRLGFRARSAEPGRAVSVEPSSCSGLPEHADDWWLTDADEDT